MTWETTQSRFLLLFLSCGATLGSKGLALAALPAQSNLSNATAILIPLVTMFFPGLLLAFLAT